MQGVQGNGDLHMLMIPTEQGEQEFIRSIDHSKIESWQHFEYLLSFIIENRFLRIYQAHLQSINLSHEIDLKDCSDKKKLQNRKKKQAK
jgi:hypothetical protein